MTTRALIMMCASLALGCAGHRRAEGSRQATSVKGDVERLRAATRAFRVVDSAVMAGYPASVNACLVHEHHGAMGYHHVNRAYMDGQLEVEKPEILLYERLADSTYRLNGVEYILPFQYWPRDSAPPTLMGQRLLRADNLDFW